MSELQERIAALSLEQRAELEARLLGSQRGRRAPAFPVGAPDDGSAPLSLAQQPWWLAEQLRPGNLAANQRVVRRFRGPLDTGVLERCLAEIVRRHAALRTSFVRAGDQPVQVVSPEAVVPLRRDCLPATLPAEERDAAVSAWIEATTSDPFDLARGPLARAALLQVAPDQHLLVLEVHHIVFDGWSGKVLFRELATLYPAFARGEASPLPPLPLQYPDFARWQAAQAGDARAAAALAYWKERLAAAPAPLELPADRPSTGAPDGRAGLVFRLLSAPLAGRLQRLGHEEGATHYMVLLAALQTLLCRLTGQEDVIVGSPVAGRDHPELETLVGCFIRSLPMRTDLSGDPPFRALLRRVREGCGGDLARSEVAPEALAGAMPGQRLAAGQPAYRVVLALQNMPGAEPEIPGLEIDRLKVVLPRTPYDLTLYLRETPAGLHADFEYRTDRFDEATVVRLAGHFETLLEGIAADPDRGLSRLPLLTRGERRQILGEWRGGDVPYPEGAALPQLFEAQAARSPDAPALLFEGAALTYRELNARANQVGRCLQARGMGRGILVGLCLERSLESVVALLGILKAGAAYVPLDPEHPAERLAYFLRDARLTVVVTDRKVGEGRLGASGLFAGLDLFCLDEPRAQMAAESTANLDGDVGPDDPLYVLYTSGSTGAPKGVVGLHRGAVNRSTWMGRRFPFAADEVCCHKTASSWVDSVAELFDPLLHGVPTLLLRAEAARDPDRLVAALREAGVTRLVLVPSLLAALLDRFPDLGHRLPRLRTWFCSGEPLPPELARRFHAATPNARLLNVYGSSEVSADVTWHDTASASPLTRRVPIGRPLDNARVYVLDRWRNPVPVGVPGDLYVGGAGLAGGYLHRPDLAEERFPLVDARLLEADAPDASPLHHSPLTPDPSPLTRLFRTGDRARWLANGTLDLLGRTDDLVKIRGHRVSPAEVESVLREHPQVRAAMVLARQRDAAERQLVAYVVAAPGSDPSAGDLREYLRERVPGWMVPGALLLLPELPLTPAGKVDRARLPAPGEADREPERAGTPPRDSLEWELAGLWAEVLETPGVGVEESFFELGGHSLLAVRLLVEVERRFGKRVPVATLLEAPDVARFAARLRGPDLPPASCLVALQPEGNRPPFFCVHSLDGLVIYYRNLARRLGPEQPFYGLQARAHARGEPFRTRVEELAADYLAEIRALRPRGPYCLGGLSFGGLVAWEMAQQLQAAGEEVAPVALLDTWGPGYPRYLPQAGRLGSHLRNVLRATPEGRKAYLRTRLDAARRRLRRRAERLLPNLTSTGPASANAAERAHLEAIRAYVVQPYAGRVTLFRALEQPTGCVADPRSGWGPFAPNLEVHAIPGGHGGIIVEPNVRELAAALARCFARGDGALPIK